MPVEREIYAREKTVRIHSRKDTRYICRIKYPFIYARLKKIINTRECLFNRRYLVTFSPENNPTKDCKSSEGWHTRFTSNRKSLRSSLSHDIRELYILYSESNTLVTRQRSRIIYSSSCSDATFPANKQEKFVKKKNLTTLSLGLTQYDLGAKIPWPPICNGSARMSQRIHISFYKWRLYQSSLIRWSVVESVDVSPASLNLPPVRTAVPERRRSSIPGTQL